MKIMMEVKGMVRKKENCDRAVSDLELAEDHLVLCGEIGEKAEKVGLTLTEEGETLILR